MVFKKTTLIVIALSLVCLNLSAQPAFDPAAYQTQSTFSLNDHPLKAESAFAVLTDEFFSGQTEAIMVEFFAGPLTEEGKTDILTNDGDEFFRGKEHATMILFIDKENKIWQVNLTQVMPGNTVGYTVAGNREELTRFADYEYNGQRLKLKSQGSYKSANYPSTLAWEIDIDIPVEKTE